MWADLVQELGLGALVFVSDDSHGADEEIQCEFWTLGKLRDYLRHEQEDDEVMYRLLRAAEKGGGYPIVVIPATDFPVVEERLFSGIGGRLVP